MSYRRNKCCYFGCINSLANNPGCRMFKFPRNVERCRIWILNSGNAKFEQLSPETLNRRKAICSDHFRENDYANPLGFKKRLNKWAVPIPYKATESEEPSTSQILPPELKIKTPVKTSTNAATSPKTSLLPTTFAYLSDSTNLPFTAVSERNPSNCYKSVIDTLNVKIHKKDKLLRQKNKTIIQLKQKIHQLSKRISGISPVYSKEQFRNDFSSSFLKTLFLMQACHKQNKKWSENEKYLALKIYLKSPRTYKYLRDRLKIVLPRQSTLDSWI